MTIKARENPKARPERSDKNERLEARISREQKELIQRAADLQGQSLTDFVLGSVADAARRIIQEHEMLELIGRDREIFIDALLNPPEPSERLLEAAKRYKQIMGDK